MPMTPRKPGRRLMGIAMQNTMTVQLIHICSRHLPCRASQKDENSPNGLTGYCPSSSSVRQAGTPPEWNAQPEFS
jgi:hypothetical protein